MKIFIFFLILAVRAPFLNAAKMPDLDQLIQQARKTSPLLYKIRSQENKTRGYQEMAKRSSYPFIRAQVLFGPIFEETGNALVSTSNLKKWGPLVMSTVDVAQPLYTFGRISKAKEAASYATESQKYQSIHDLNELDLKIKDLHMDWLYAESLKDLVSELISFLNQATQDSQQMKRHTLYKLEIEKMNLEQKFLLLEQKIDEARTGLEGLVGKKFHESGLKWVSQKLKPIKFQRQSPTPETFKKQVDISPQFLAMEKGILARQAFAESHKSGNLPQFFFGGQLGFSWSPVRERQKSIFANDPFNRMQVAMGFGFRWELNFSKHATYHRERAAQLKLESEKMLLTKKDQHRIFNLFNEIKNHQKRLELSQKRLKHSKKWFASNGVKWSLGKLKGEEFIESFEGDAKAKQNHIDQVYQLNKLVMAYQHFMRGEGE